MSLRRLFLAMTAVAALCTVGARAQDGNDLSIGAKLDYASKYVWRGIPYNEDAIVQPSLTLGYAGFELNILGIIDTTNTWGREDNFEEVDYTLSYTHKCNEDLTASVGAIYYVYPGQGFDEDLEVYASAAYAAPLNPVLTVVYDCRNGDGWYINLAASHVIALPEVHENLDLILDANLGWATENWNNYIVGVNDNAFVNLSPGATLKYTASEKLSFAWYARYDYLLDQGVRDNVQANGFDGSNFTFGANVAVNF
jgi:hypothetical protein